MQYTLFQDDFGINVFDGNNIYKINDIKELKSDANSIIIVCGQSFICRLPIYDISTIEKMIFFPGRKDLKRMYEKYSHKTIDISNVSNVLKGISYVFKRQQEYVDSYQLRIAVDFHAQTSAILSYINAGTPIIIKDSAINELNELGEQLSKENILSRQELMSHMTKRRYNFIDINTGKFRFDHAFLLSLNDPVLNQHVNGERMRSKFIQKNILKKEMRINHNIYGAITGRIQTSEPNIQGIDKKVIQPTGTLYSFDFTGFEIIIYLALFNKPLLQQFKESGKNDIFGWMFFKIYPNKFNFDSDNLKPNEPEIRDKFKKLVIRSLYGATQNDMVYWYGDNIIQLYKSVLSLLSIVSAKKELIDFATRTGRYLINKKYNLSIQDRWVKEYFILVPESKKWEKIITDDPVFSDSGRFVVQKDKFDELYTKERGIIEKCIEAYQNVSKLCLNYHIQGTGAFIIKQSIQNVLKSKISSQVLILRHDEIVVDIKNNEDIEKIQMAMTTAAIQIIGSGIFVKAEKI